MRNVFKLELEIQNRDHESFRLTFHRMTVSVVVKSSQAGKRLQRLLSF